MFVVAAGAPAPVRGAVFTWDGGSLLNDNWNTPANWSSDLVPGALDTAVFDGTSIENANINLSVWVQAAAIYAGYTGIITPGAGNFLTVGRSTPCWPSTASKGR